MTYSLQAIVLGIQSEASRIAKDALLKKFADAGGVVDPQLDVFKIISDVGPTQAAIVTLRIAQFKRELRRLYGLRPTMIVEHMELVRKLTANGWMRRS